MLKIKTKQSTKDSVIGDTSKPTLRPVDKDKHPTIQENKDDSKFDTIDWSKRHTDEHPPNKFDTIDWSTNPHQKHEPDKFDTIDWKKNRGVISDNKKDATKDQMNMKLTTDKEDRINAKVTNEERKEPKSEEEMARLYRQKGGRPYYQGEPTRAFKEFKKLFQDKNVFTKLTKSEIKYNPNSPIKHENSKSEKQLDRPVNSKSRYKYDINDMRKIAKERGGKCLSEKYKGYKTNLKWQCREGHEWKATPDNVKNQGTWCPECVGHFKYTIKDMQKLAENRGGKCLSKEYTNSKTNLKWQCANGHEWEATPDNIKNQGSWCPKCSDSTFEHTCRQFVERLFNKKFRKSYPKWLRNPEGNRMHLDGENKEIKAAFEAQGIQHYKFSPYFHKTMKRFLKDQKNDKVKNQLCKENDVKLIKIPYTIKIDQMEKFIRDKVKELRITAPLNPNKIDYKQFKLYNESKLKEMQKLAECRGGKLLSKKYINALTPLKWQCEKGHTWEASPNNIKNNAKGSGGLKGNWCPDCAQRRKYTLEDVKAFAKSKGGECLSKKYERAQAPLKWRCENNHEFTNSFYNVNIKNSWCPECKKDQYLQRYKKIAEERSGKLLSEKYVNTSTPLEWQCEYGHTWSAIPNSIKQGSWCPDCAGKHEYDINNMKAFAKSYGGDCLSKKYLGGKEYLEWRCSEGHEFKATPNNLLSHKNWCPECKREKRIANNSN